MDWDDRIENNLKARWGLDDREKAPRQRSSGVFKNGTASAKTRCTQVIWLKKQRPGPRASLAARPESSIASIPMWSRPVVGPRKLRSRPPDARSS